MLDVVVVGGGPAGMSAALVLGRSRRRTRLFDHGPPRNEAADHAHNLFTREGTTPGNLHAISRAQLDPYPSVEVVDGEVTRLRRTEGGFVVTDAGGREHAARRVLLATGVEDDLPAFDGFERFWGRSAFHCPYCHGWESRDRRLAVLGNRSRAEAFASVELMRGWTKDLVLCTDGAIELGDGERDVLALLEVDVRERPIAALEGGDALERIRFDDGSAVVCQGMYLHPPQHVRGELLGQLGCRLCDNGLVEVGTDWQTSVPGVFAAGDMSSTLQQVVTAAASGTAAAIALNRGLIADDFADALARAEPGRLAGTSR